MAESDPRWDINKATQVYSIDRWGAPYFSINPAGEMIVTPIETGPQLVLSEVARYAQERGLHYPMVIRFQDILRDRVDTLNKAFSNSIAEFNYKGFYRGVFPIKVNQLREVVEEILDAGARYHFGLEAGSKPELAAALAMHKDPESLIICNGYKDQEFVRLALIGRRLGKQVILVVEKIEELNLILRVAKEMGVKPWLGFRIRLQSKSAGKWAMSSGEDAKFGLSATDLVDACDLLQAENLSECFKLVHFHIGSQVPDIRIVKKAVREAGRYYAKVRQLGFPVEYVDVGGGLGVDYDGSRSASESSVNYSLQEYCADVVYNLAEVCEAEKVPHPNIVSESGRAIVSHHSVLIVEVFGATEKTKHTRPVTAIAGEHRMIQDMRSIYDGLNKRNRRESLHDAQQIRDESEAMFALGLLSLREKASVDDLYWFIAERVAQLYEGVRSTPEEIRSLNLSLGDQYICNFSVFQSLLDHWAVGQLFPVVPISRLNEEPTNRGFLVDITCDSDGKMAKFIDGEGVRETLPLHRWDGRPYYLGFFLIGAYQDVMGDIHNLFGRLNEAHVFIDQDEEDGYYIEETIPGDTVKSVLAEVQYDIHELQSEMKAHVDASIKRDQLKPNEGMRLLAEYQRVLDSHTYLRPGEPAPVPNGVAK